MPDATAFARTCKDAWSHVDDATDPASFARSLHDGEARTETPDHYRATIASLGLQQGGSLLEVGCGTGTALCAMSRLTQAQVQAVGIDNSAFLITLAQQHAAQLGVPVSFVQADAHELPYADQMFDACYTKGVLEIVPGPDQVVREMVRVLRPGKRLLLIAEDVEATIMATDEPAITRKLFHYISDVEMNGWIGRQLVAVCADLGLSDITVAVVPRLTVQYPPHFMANFGGFVARAQAAGAISASEAATWLTDVEQRGQTDRYLACQTYFRVAATKPEADAG